jgi:hypothetical protein
MIAYDELVAALTNWRAKQGLPISSTAVPGSGPTQAPGSGPVAKAGSGPTRSAPPAPPKGGYQPPPLAEATADEPLDVADDALLEEAQYEPEGGDFAMAFGGNVERHDEEESTTLGQAPEPAQRDSFGGETALDPKSRKPW